MENIIKKIRRTSGCAVLPHSGLPRVPTYALPEELIQLYTLCGGMKLFQDEEYGITVVSPNDFVRANPVISRVEWGDDISDHWFIVATANNSQYITVDLDPVRSCRCYDSFWDRHAIAGSCPIIALSVRELLERLLGSEGCEWYWTDPDFVSYGDAYGQAGQEGSGG
jgi:hypothetical protein